MSAPYLFDAPGSADMTVSAGPGAARRRKATPKPPHPLAGDLPALDHAEGRIVWRLTHEARPWTLNVERQGGGGGHYGRAMLVREWRNAFAVLALQAHMWPCEAIAVTARPELRHAGGIPDTAACIGAAKAAIDGVRDAGVLPDDGPQYVRRLTFEAPVITGRDALTLDIEVLS